MSNDLFIQLEKYGSSKDRTQTENFLTELVAHVLRKEPVAREEYITLVAGEWAKVFSKGSAEVKTQVTTQSVEPRLSGLRLDLLLTCGDSELIVENKVGDELTEGQLHNYLDYASEGNNRRVAVVSRVHQATVDSFRDHPNWLKETLWREIAEKWARKRNEFSSPWLIDAMLEFMRRYDMGPIEPFTEEDVKVPELWRKFVAKKEQILSRVSTEIVQPEWAARGQLQRRGVYPPTYSQKALDYQGVLCCGLNCANADSCTFWYFLGFLYKQLSWMPPFGLEPECLALLGIWVDPQRKQPIRELLVDAAEKINRRLDHGAGDSICRILESENNGVFLCRQKSLSTFTDFPDQTSAILKFFADSHNAIKDEVSGIRTRYLELPENGQEGDSN